MIPLTNQKLLIISPHPDDEVLGCGGLIKRVKDEGGKVYVLFMTVGYTKEYSQNGNSHEEQRLNEVENVAAFFQYDDYRIVFHGDKYHLQLDNIPQKDIIDEIENGPKVSLNAIKPTIIATPYLIDYNQDHRSTTQAGLAAARPMPDVMKPMQPLVLGYESVATADWWSSPRTINVFLPLSDHDLDIKIEGLQRYTSQIRPNYHPRSLTAIRNLAYFRGMQIGEKAAEGFYCYRMTL